MDPMFAVCIVIAVAGLSVALSLNAVTEAIKEAASAIRMHTIDMNTSTDVIKNELQHLIDVIEDK